MNNDKYYAGIGSRSTPESILEKFIEIASELAVKGCILRSGGADGADLAFEYGCVQKDGKMEIFIPWANFNNNPSRLFNPTPEAFELSSKYHPYWHNLKQGAKRLHARNAHQILGLDLKTPVDFVICWTGLSGGTNQALRIAKSYKIPIFNFIDKLYTIKDILGE